MISLLAQLQNPVIQGNLGTDTEGKALAPLLATVIRFLVVIGGIIMLLFLITGAIAWITAEGKPDKLEKARDQIMQAITGMIILAAVIAIATLIGNILGFDFLNINLPNVNEL